MRRALAVILAVASAVVLVGVGSAHASADGVRTLVVRNDPGFAWAAARMRASGGTIVLRPGSYASLALGPRSARLLRVVGSPGTRVGRFLLAGTEHVSISRLAFGPVGGDAGIELQRARDIDLHHLLVSAQGTRFQASIFIAYAPNVRIPHNTFTHCGDFSPRVRELRTDESRRQRRDHREQHVPRLSRLRLRARTLRALADDP
jgi:hypothetical protein